MTQQQPRGKWLVEFDEEFFLEFQQWPEEVQDALVSHVGPLRVFGPTLGRPLVDTLKGSRFLNMKELRVSAATGAWRVAFAFDPKRRAILLVGGNKSGVSSSRFYANLIRIADSRYERHLKSVEDAKEER